MKECEGCGHQENVMSSDPLDSFVITLYHSEIIQQMQKYLARDERKGEIKADKYVSKLFKKVLRSLFSKCQQSECENKEIVDFK